LNKGIIMKDWFDREQIWCIPCGHRWVLVSNKAITQQEHEIWVKAVMKHHEQIKEEKEEEK